MGRMTWKFRSLLAVVAAGDLRTAQVRVGRWVDSELSFYGLRRDLAAPHPPPLPKVAVKVRPLTGRDISSLMKISSRSGKEIYELMSRREFMEIYPEGCFLAVNQDEQPCYLQWLITPAKNVLVREYFGGLFPWLAADEVLLEQAYTFEAFRGLGIMPYAMSKLAEMGRREGARWAITFVAQDNLSALKGCRRAGFRPYLIRREVWKRFNRRVSFQFLPSHSLSSFEEGGKSLRRNAGV